jgi:multimeric flavodoxin WrbA
MALISSCLVRLSGWGISLQSVLRSWKGSTRTLVNLNDEGQYIYYGKVGGCLITGNEDGAKHVAMNVLYSLHHIGYTIPPQVDSTWLGEAGPGPSYGDKLDDGSRAGFDNDFTNKNTTFMTYNLMHMAKMLKDNGGFPVYGNQQSAWNNGNRFGFENPEYR